MVFRAEYVPGAAEPFRVLPATSPERRIVEVFGFNSFFVGLNLALDASDQDQVRRRPVSKLHAPLPAAAGDRSNRHH